MATLTIKCEPLHDAKGPCQRIGCGQPATMRLELNSTVPSAPGEDMGPWLICDVHGLEVGELALSICRKAVKP